MKAIKEFLSLKRGKRLLTPSMGRVMYSDEERKKFKETDFGLPKTRKYPMLNKRDVAMAARGFHRAREEDKKMLAKRIMKKAKEFGVTIKDPGILKYAKR